MLHSLLLCSLLLSPGDELRLAPLFQEGMVLQRDTQANLWGWCAPGAEVQLQASWHEQPVRVVANADGAWIAQLTTGAAGGPHQLEVSTAGQEPIAVGDLWLGEVWLCSGQSNMEWALLDTERGYGGVQDCEAAAAQADYPGIRLFNVPNRPLAQPDSHCDGAWEVCTPTSAKHFSATAFFFARKLHAELGVPIGLITSDWGGTPAQAWTPLEELRDFPRFGLTLQSLKREREVPGSLASEQASQAASWWAGLGSVDEGSKELLFAQEEFDHSDWKTLDLPVIWEETEVGDFDGLAWFRRTVTIPDEWAGKPLRLSLGPIDDMDSAWFAGTRIGGLETTGVWNVPRVYDIPAELVVPGTHTLALRALDTGGAGGFSGEASSMVLRPKDAGAEASQSLAGAWSYKLGSELSTLPARPSGTSVNSQTATALFNGMLAPLVPYTLRGAIWYQGESNWSHPEEYVELFPAMIRGWRRVFAQGDFPFYFVQIAPFGYGGDEGQAAELREAQLFACRLPRTGMVVTMDIGDPADIHPQKKREVGERLALWALRDSYERDIECEGPQPASWEREGGSMRIHFDHAEGLTGTPGPFTIAGSDRVFKPAKAEITGESVRVWSEEVPEPVAVRFAWGAADETDLRNQAGLPSTSFRTDSWPRASSER